MPANSKRTVGLTCSGMIVSKGTQEAASLRAELSPRQETQWAPPRLQTLSSQRCSQGNGSHATDGQQLFPRHTFVVKGLSPQVYEELSKRHELAEMGRSLNRHFHGDEPMAQKPRKVVGGVGPQESVSSPPRETPPRVTREKTATPHVGEGGEPVALSRPRWEGGPAGPQRHESLVGS